MKMSLFNKKKSILTADLLSETIDIHCHILPGVDDGCTTFSEAVTALRRFYELGVRRLYLTPHIMSEYPHNNAASLNKAFAAFTQQLASELINDVPHLKLAAEYMLEPDFETHKKQGLMTFNDRFVLVETSYLSPPIALASIINQLIADDYKPILAHPERYAYMDFCDYSALRDDGVQFQLNFFSISGIYGKTTQRKAVELLQNGFCHFVGSDFHQLAHYERAVKELSLTSKQIASLQPLFTNNDILW